MRYFFIKFYKCNTKNYISNEIILRKEQIKCLESILSSVFNQYEPVK